MGTFFCPYIKPLSIDGKQWNDTARRAERGGGGGLPYEYEGDAWEPQEIWLGDPLKKTKLKRTVNYCDFHWDKELSWHRMLYAYS